MKIINIKNRVYYIVAAIVIITAVTIIMTASGGKAAAEMSLPAGVYSVTGEVLKTDRETKSMADSAVEHNMKLTVSDNTYRLTFTINEIKLGVSTGYLGNVRYYLTGYGTDSFGIPAGDTKESVVNSYKTDKNGTRIKDEFGTDYPESVTVELIPEAVLSGYVPLQIYIPVMESLAAGSGTQDIYIHLDMNSVREYDIHTASPEQSPAAERTAEPVQTKSGTGAKISSENRTTVSGKAASDGSNEVSKKSENTDKSDSKKTSTKKTSAKKTPTVSEKKKSSKKKSSKKNKNTKNKKYNCTVNAGYRHPVTGKIEDSGGESAYETGQAMVKSMINTKGKLELTNEGGCYLTFTMSLVEYISGQEYMVQKKDDDGWKKVEPVITGSGKDKNGTTSDVRIMLPSSDSIVRVSANIEVMGRDVIFYIWAGKVADGNKTDNKTDNSNVKNTGAKSEKSNARKNKESNTKKMQSTDVLQDDAGSPDEVLSENDSIINDGISDESIHYIAGNDGTVKGLSLSTEREVTQEDNSDNQNVQNMNTENQEKNNQDTYKQDMEDDGIKDNGITVGEWVVILTSSFTLAGLILMGAAFLMIRYFLNNIWRWNND